MVSSDLPKRLHDGNPIPVPPGEDPETVLRHLREQRQPKPQPKP